MVPSDYVLVEQVAYYSFRKMALPEYVKPRHKINYYMNLLNLFLLGLDRENCRAALPGSGGILDQYAVESRIWGIFLSQYIQRKIEEGEKHRVTVKGRSI